MKPGIYIKQVLGTLVFFTIIFLSAGRIMYWQGLTYLTIGIIMLILNFTLFQPDTDLLKERSKPGDGSKKWDKVILGLTFLTTIGMYIIAGLDSGRYHWSLDFHWSVYIIGAIFTITGQVLFLMAQKENRYFSSTVRIQTDRGHIVCDTGIYKTVRHPAYLGSIIQLTGFPMLFGSLWSLIPVIISIGLHIIRTGKEDKTLQNELSGYAQYTLKTKYRLIPGVW